jgi:hypothetical protein
VDQCRIILEFKSNITEVAAEFWKYAKNAVIETIICGPLAIAGGTESF